ncbi:hypothetical protein [Mesorhizobium sp. ISC11]|uniref:hypothetical protein n=1 Tax=Mesorhizobium sp. ISC11 TaxID=3076428 RepID=UPI00301D7C47
MATFWKSPREIFRAIEREALAGVDGRYVAVTTLQKKWQAILLQEARVWEASGMQPEDLPVYEATVAPTRALIEAADAETLRLMLDWAARGKWFAVGRRNIEAGEEVIPGRYWPFLTLDMKNATAKGDGLDFRALRCAFVAAVPADDPILEKLRLANSENSSPQLVANLARILPTPRKRGPKPKKLMSVKTEMLNFDRHILETMTEEAMAEQFKASRDTCRRARQELSELK